jgi:hypothetical protein
MKGRNNNAVPMMSCKITRRYTMQIESERRQATGCPRDALRATRTRGPCPLQYVAHSYVHALECKAVLTDICSIMRINGHATSCPAMLFIWRHCIDLGVVACDGTRQVELSKAKEAE